jgi:dTMP kinase
VQALPAENNRLRQPDLTVWFDLPPSVAAERLAGARLPDRFESQPLAFFERVAGGYSARMQQDPARFVRIASDQPKAAVWRQVRLALEQRGWLSAEVPA